MGNEVFEAMVNRHSDRSRAKKERATRGMLGLLTILAVIAATATIAYATGLNHSPFNLTIGALAAFCAAFIGGRIWERTR